MTNAEPLPRNRNPWTLIALWLLFSFTSLSLLFPQAIWGHEEKPVKPPKPFVVLTKTIKPFVMNKDGTLQGFSIDLLKELMKELKWNY